MIKQTVLAAIALTALSGCTTVSNMYTGKGTGEIVDLKDGTFEVTSAGSFSADRSVTYAKWERTATKACGGRAYVIIKREWQMTEYPGLLSGIIRCS